MLLGIVAKPNKRDKFEVTPESVAYLSALVSVSEEVRGRCHARQPRMRSNVSSGSGSGDPFNVDLRLDLHSNTRHSPTNQASNLSPVSNYSSASTVMLHTSASHNALSSIQGSNLNSPVSSGSCSSTTHLLVPSSSGSAQTSPNASAPTTQTPPPGRRQKSWDLLDQSAITIAKQQRQQQPQLQQQQQQSGNGAKALFKTQRSFSVPTTREQRSLERNSTGIKGNLLFNDLSNDQSEDLLTGATVSLFCFVGSDVNNSPTQNDVQENNSARASVSGESNCLLDPDILTNFSTQALVLTVLATLVKYTTDENEMRVLYEYLAEASVVFPRVFPIIHSLLDAKITNVLSLCHDQGILAAVQSIIQNMIALEGGTGEQQQQQQLHYLQSCGFGGLWRFAGPFTKSNCTAESAELFVNCLEALVETCLPVEEGEAELAPFPSMLSVSSNMNLSSSLSSLTLGSPTDKGK